MKRAGFASGFCAVLLSLLLSGVAFAQGEDDGLPPEPDQPPAPSDTDLSTSKKDVEVKDDATPTITQRERGGDKKSWRDIVVVPRKKILKRGRVELSPFYGTTINDNLIQHSALGAEVNYFLTDILSIGVLGMALFDNVLEQEFLTRYHFGRVPSLNKYRYAVTLNFGYVPIYGKFALFNDRIFHYDIYITGGVGITGTEVIPRNYENQAFSNIALTFPVGMGGRLFVTKWLAVHVAFRDFMMLDSFEAPNRLPSAEKGKETAETRFINNIMFNVGASFYLPTSFEYTTFR